MTEWVSRFDGQVDVEGVISAEQLARVPAKRGVLALLAAGGEPIVLLTAADMRGRLRSRLTAPQDDKPTRSADLRAVTRRVHYKLAYSHFETDLVYAELARAIWPERYGSLIAWKPAWFVQAVRDEGVPHVVPTCRIGAGPGQCIGPFPAARHARRFAGLIVEAFDLCRNVHLLKQAPHARPCAYAQMGRCPSPCDGSISMARYAEMVSEALAYACGRRDALRGDLRRRMRRAAEALEFERAAALKARLDRLAEFERDVYAHAEPLDRFIFLLIQPGGSVRKARAFVACGPEITPPATLDYPPEAEQIEALLRRAAALAGREQRWEPFGRLMAGLVSRYLFSSERRRGLIVRWEASMTAEALRQAIEAAADVLGLRAPAKGGKKPPVRSSKRVPSQERSDGHATQPGQSARPGTS